ncbi:uncharacterized protein [Nicotiana sylvestris]|uniref:uncharacterized protein n=1 Tax=Nicotiana sylvestris TaxID=4096 RepID=UPI00388C6B00
MPDIPKNDGIADPRDHVIVFRTSVKGNDLSKQEIESVLVKIFRETLINGALTWYSLLLENSIDYFAELADSFIKAHSGAQKIKKRITDIFKIKQGDAKLLNEFVDRFQRERMMLPCVPDNWAAMAFASNLNEKSSEAMRRLKESLREFPATTWNDVYNRYCTKLQIEEDTTTQSRGDERVSSRRPKTKKRSGKNRYEPYMGPAGRDSHSKQENLRYDSRSRDKDPGSPSNFERNETHEIHGTTKEAQKRRFATSFNVSTS